MNNFNKAFVLLVDDNLNNLIAMESVLKGLEHSTIFATSAKEALRYVLRYDFAVILLDVQMPDMDGFETARLIRNRERSRYTPIIFMSAWQKDEIDVNKGYAIGAADYLFKPINPDILRYKVKVFIDLFTKSALAVKLETELKNRLRAEQQAHRQKRQLELAQLERIHTMEEMSSALAHELNQPLATITNYIKGCMHRLKHNEYHVDQLLEALQQASDQAERAGAILHRIKDFVRKNKLYLEPHAIFELIANIPMLLTEEIQAAAVQLDIQLGHKSPPKMLLDKIQFEQVLINLMRNSIEVLQGCQHPRQLTVSANLKKPKTLIIQVKDNGPGIDPQTAAKLFDLYFTTKPDGMGVGLAICRTIIEAHGGHISASNTPSGGACFQINLPVVT